MRICYAQASDYDHVIRKSKHIINTAPYSSYGNVRAVCLVVGGFGLYKTREYVLHIRARIKDGSKYYKGSFSDGLKTKTAK